MLGLVVGGPDLVPLAVGQLALNGIPVPALLVQNGARGGAKPWALISSPHHKKALISQGLLYFTGHSRIMNWRREKDSNLLLNHQALFEIFF